MEDLAASCGVVADYNPFTSPSESAGETTVATKHTKMQKKQKTIAIQHGVNSENIPADMKDLIHIPRWLNTKDNTVMSIIFYFSCVPLNSFAGDENLPVWYLKYTNVE